VVGYARCIVLAGKTVLLTGATGGLGRAIAEALASRGARLVLSSRKAEELSALAASLPGDGHRVAVADLALEGAAERLAAEAGEIDCLVANAGLQAGGRLERFAVEELIIALRVNLEAPTVLARALIPAMNGRGEGHLVFISSLQGKVALPRSSVYSATKFGLRGFALSLREDLRGAGVGVSVVLPGFIREAGIFADSGVRAPAGLGTSSPADVGEAVARAIERDQAEVAVAPLQQRLGAGFAHRYPRIAARVTRGNAERVAEKVIEGRAAKR
jgi:short-subunit dehydrogenase